MRRLIELLKRLEIFQDKEVLNEKIMSMILLAVIILGIITLGLGIYTQTVTQTLSENILRFHVVANSDTTEDQLLKQQVKDEIIAYMQPLLKNAEDIDESKRLIMAYSEDIKQVANRVVSKWGKDYKVQLFIDHANFPTKSYGDIILPAGEYEACRIIIGEGKGENWWCIMFPPLCYVDAATGVVPAEGKAKLQEQLTDEQYNMICNADAPYEIRFKIVDKVNNLLKKESYKEAIMH